MARKLAILLVLLLSGGVRAGINPRLDSLRTRAFEQADVPSGGTSKVTTSIGNSFINRAISKVCSNAPAIEKYDTIYVDSITEGGSLPSDFNRLKSAELIWSDTSLPDIDRAFRIPLLPIEGDSQTMQRPSLQSLQQDRTNPLAARFYRTYAGKLKLFPKWMRGDSAAVVIEYYANDTLLQVNASQTSVEERWREAVINYAASLISAKRNNYEDALYYLNLFRADVGLPPLKREDYLEK